MRRRAAPHHDTSAFPYFVADRPARLRLFLCAAALAFATSPAGPASAQDTATDDSQAERADTRIAVDEEADVIRFFVAGEEAMRLDSAGLHVRGALKYGGRIKDVGEPATAEGGVDAN